MLDEPKFPRTLFHIGWRYLRLHRWQSLLMVLGIMLGVAVMVSIDLANASAARAFELSTESVTGKATHQIAAASTGIDERVYVDLLRAGSLHTAAPVVTAIVSSAQLGNQPLQLLGIDPFVDSPFRNYLGGENAPPMDGLIPFLTQPGALLISRETADRYNLRLGDTISLYLGGIEKQAFVAGVIDAADALTQRALSGILLADIATAQELTGMIGKLSRIDLILPKGDAAAVEKIQAALPVGLQISTVEARRGSIEQMTSAFQLNLMALSMLALVVGLFLIYNTMTFSVVQRRPLFGRLRCLGVTRREIFILVLSEALVVGVIGSALGVLLGVLMGQNTIGMVTRTINDLYFTTTVQETGIPLASLIKGGLIGLAATISTTILPAWEAASVPPQAALTRSGLESKSRQQVPRMALAGSGLAALGVLAFFLPGTGLYTGFGGTLAVVVGFA
ncbi:MAG: FtsX-like permease family protein, partial [Anaerolineaceae bacterium]